MKSAHIIDVLEGVPEKKIDSGSFGEVFQMDGIPLWYFLRPLINSSFLPKPFKPQWEIEQEINRGELPSSLDRAKSNLRTFLLRKGLEMNEWTKLVISKSDREHLKETGKKDVLFISSTNNIPEKDGKLEYLEHKRILDSLRRGKKIKTLVLAYDPFSKNSLFNLNKYAPLVYDYITPEILEKSRQISRDLHRKWKALDEKSKTMLFSWGHGRYWKHFENDMDFLFSRELLFTLTKYYLAFKEIIEKHGIKVVYLNGLANLHELSALGAAYKLDIKVVYSSHGYTRGTAEGWELLKNVTFAAGGEENRRDLLRSGIKKDDIAITGFPFLDEIVYHKRTGAPRAKKTVTLLTTTLVESKFMAKEKYFKLMRETLAQIKKVKEIGRVVIKLHPKERYRSKYEFIVKSLGMKNAEIVQIGKTPLYSLLSDSDLLMGFGSTAVLEGMMLGKNAIHLEMFELERPAFEFKQAALCVKDIDGIAGAVKKVLADRHAQKELKEKRERYLRRAFYSIDGRAHERVAELIASFV